MEQLDKAILTKIRDDVNIYMHAVDNMKEKYSGTLCYRLAIAANGLYVAVEDIKRALNEE